MEMQVEIIGKELIKPSSPTPHHLRHLQLSFLDQWQAPMALPFIFFYPKISNIPNIQPCNLLKESLSEALTIFYPLAGRINNNSYINCNDEGLLFVQAKANCPLSEVLQNRNPNINNKFTHRGPDDPGDLAAFCQITLFNCGGFALSFSMSHKVGDAFSELMFINNWAAITRGNTSIVNPWFGFSTLFPPSKNCSFEQSFSKEKLVTKVFVFDGSAISALKAKYTKNGEKVSRVVALASFLWSRFVVSTQSKEDRKKKLYKVFQWVNLRPRMELPQFERCCGNLISVVGAEADMECEDDECYGIVKRMKDCLKNVNSDYVRKLQNSDEHLKFLNKMGEELGKGVVSFDISSFCNFPMHETDFGWGKPSWVGTGPQIFKNLVYFLDTKDGKGIEAWVGEYMAKFQMDKQLLAHVSSTYG